MWALSCPGRDGGHKGCLGTSLKRSPQYFMIHASDHTAAWDFMRWAKTTSCYYDNSGAAPRPGTPIACSIGRTGGQMVPCRALPETTSNEPITVVRGFLGLSPVPGLRQSTGSNCDSSAPPSSQVEGARLGTSQGLGG